MVATTQTAEVRARPVSGAVADTVVGWLSPGGPGAIAAQTAGWGRDEWAEARRATLVHGIAPLLAARLAHTPSWRDLDAELRAYCVAQRSLNGQRLARMLPDLAAILRASSDAGVAVLPLKGAVLAEQYYGEPGLRPMADIDMLVRPEQLGQLDAVMAGLGFALAEETPRHRDYRRPDERVVSWDGEHPDNPRGVEVHAAVGEHLRAIRYDITAAMWAGATLGSYAGAPGLTPAPGSLLQHLLIHTCHNMVNRRLRLIQLYDIALVAPRVDGPAWHAAARSAIGAGEARLLYAPLTLAEAVFGPLAPDGVRESLAQATPPALRRMLRRLTPSAFSLCNRSEVSPSFRLAWYHPGREQIGALLRVLVPSPEELRQRYPSLADSLSSAYLCHLRHTAGWMMRAVMGGGRPAANR